MTKRELLEALENLLSRAKDNDSVVFIKKERNESKTEYFYNLVEPRKLEMVCYEPKTEEGEYPVEWVIELL